MSSVYEVSCSGIDDCGMSDVYMLESVVERKPLRDDSFKLALCCCVFPEWCVCFASYDVVCHKFYVWEVSVQA